MSNNSKLAALTVIRKLQANGYEAFLVGGCVRDILLRRDPKDFDVTTNALPEQVRNLFEKTLPIGASFGVIVVVVNGEQIEVATYRADGAYTDGRRPDTVEFGKTAKDDIERRDFTMNGLLLTPPMDFRIEGITNEDWEMFDGDAIVDFVGGQADIDLRIIRAIGDPNKRFEEDALRMLRAVRFAAQLGFDIEVRTKEAIEDNAHLLKNVSHERIAMELFKMFSAPFPLRGLVPFIATGLYRHALPDGFASHVNMTYALQRFGMFEANKDSMLGMAMFFADVQWRYDAKLAEHLKFSTDQLKELIHMNFHVSAFQQHVSGSYTMSEAGLKRTCRMPGVQLALEIMTQDELIGKTALGVDAVMGFVLKIKAYKPEDFKPQPLVTGKDLMDLGVPPGPLYTSVLYDVETGQLEGVLDREKALRYVRESLHKDESEIWVYNPPRTGIVEAI